MQPFCALLVQWKQWNVDIRQVQEEIENYLITRSAAEL